VDLKFIKKRPAVIIKLFRAENKKKKSKKGKEYLSFGTN
jgi:hypothetical protein